MGCATTKSKDISPEIPTRGKVWTDNDRASSSTKYLCRSNSSIQGGPESQRPNENKTGHHWSQAAVCSLTEFEASAARQSPTTDADATTIGTTKKEDETGTSSSNTDGEQEPCVRFHVQAVSPVAVLDHADPLIASTVGDGDEDRLSETSPDASQITEEVNEQKQWANNQAFLDKSVFRKSRSLSLKTSNVEQSRQLMTSLARPKALFYDTPLTSEEREVQFRDDCLLSST